MCCLPGSLVSVCLFSSWTLGYTVPRGHRPVLAPLLLVFLCAPLCVTEPPHDWVNPVMGECLMSHLHL